MPRNDFEFTAVFEQLGQPLLKERSGRVTEGGVQVIVEFTAGAPVLAAEDVEQLLGEREVGRVKDGRVNGDDPLTGIANADEGAGEHDLADSFHRITRSNSLFGNEINPTSKPLASSPVARSTVQTPFPQSNHSYIRRAALLRRTIRQHLPGLHL